jgi:hypothetical protein
MVSLCRKTLATDFNINNYTGIVGTVKSVRARTVLTRGAAKSGLNPLLEEGSFKFSRICPAYMLN